MLSRSIVSDSLCTVDHQDPWTVDHQIPPSMEIFQTRIWEWVAISFSRGSSCFTFPFDSRFFQLVCVCVCVCVLVTSVTSSFLRPMDYSPPGLSVQWDSPSKNTGVGCHALLWGSSQTRDQTHASYISCIGRQVL